MKRTILLMLILVSLAQFSLAQMEVGVKGGLNISNGSFSPPIFCPGVFTYNVGYNIGAFSSFKLYRSLSAAPELLISEKGVKGMEGTYLSLPLLLNVRIYDIIFLEAGPEFDVLLVNGTLLNPHKSQTFDSGIETAIDVGLKVDINDKLVANLRYSYGLSSVVEIAFRDETGELAHEVKMYNRNVQLSLGYKIFK